MEEIKTMEKNKKENKDNNGIRFFIKTSNKNYFYILSFSIILTAFYYLFLKIKGWGNRSIFVFLFLSFFTLFRIGEYLLTKKTLSLYLFGREHSGSNAKFNFVLFILLLLFFVVISIIKSPL